MQENQRIRLSKKMLKDSLISLLADNSIHKISVRDICAGAQINRTTFYKYYGSQYDLLADMEYDVLNQIDHYLSENELTEYNSLQQLTKIIVFINDNLDLCHILFSNNIDPEFPEKLINLPKIRQTFSRLKSDYGKDELEYVFIFLVNGGFALIIHWMNKENHESPEEIATLLINTIMRLFPA